MNATFVLSILGFALIVSAYMGETPEPDATSLIKAGHAVIISAYSVLLVTKIKESHNLPASSWYKLGNVMIVMYLLFAYADHASAHKLQWYDMLSLIGHALVLASLYGLKFRGNPISLSPGLWILAAYYAIGAQARFEDGNMSQTIARIPLAIAYALEAKSPPPPENFVKES